MFGIEKDFQQLMEQVYGPLGKKEQEECARIAQQLVDNAVKEVKMTDEPVQYETPMTEIEEVKAQIKVLQSKLSFLEELEKTKSPVEEAFKRLYTYYPDTDPIRKSSTWMHFANGYKSAQKDYKVGEYQETAQERGERLHKDVERVVKESVKWCEEHPDTDPLDWLKPQTPEETEKGMREAFIKAQQTENWKETQKLIDEEDNDKNFKNSLDLIKEWREKNKPQNLTDLIYDWWEDVFTTHSDWDMETSIETLVDEISLWLPTEHDTNSYKWKI